MRKLILLVILLSTTAFAGTKLQPSTTLAAETANNTSAASAFAGWSNGVPAAGNVSKVPVSKLLPSGSGTGVYAEYQSWWGKPGQPSIGYSSLDPAQQEATVQDMTSRGVTGLIDDWYGPGSWDDKVMLSFKNVIGTHPGFAFAIMEDQGAVKWNPCSGCTATQSVIYHLNYVAKTYFVSPNYLRFNGRPVIFLFGLEVYSIDWTAVRAALPSNPLLLQRNAGAVSNLTYDGAYAWLAPMTTNYATYEGLGYLDNFYSAAAAKPSRMAIGSTFKGFDDSVAPWAPPGGRHIAQLCGKTWLDSWAHSGAYSVSLTPLRAIQLVTWNDYQEGTELETGIDNCLTVAASLQDSKVSWTITGDEGTLDHFTVFVSSDGTNLMSAGDVAASGRALDLAALGLDPGTYQVFVKAVAKPMLFNHMSAPAPLVIPALPPTLVTALVSQDAVLTSPFHLQAVITPGTYPVTSVALLIDAAPVLVTSLLSLDRWICVPSGSHVLVFNVMDSSGTVTRLTRAVTLP